MFRAIARLFARRPARPTAPAPAVIRFVADVGDVAEMKRVTGQFLATVVAEMPIDDAMEFTRWLRRFAVSLDGYDLPEPSNN